MLNGRDAAALEPARDRLVARRPHGACRAVRRHRRCRPSQRGVDAIEAEIGPIEILFNNAGMQHRAPLEEFPLDAWERLMATNIDSVFFVGQAVAQAT